jgi:plastocyanin
MSRKLKHQVLAVSGAVVALAVTTLLPLIADHAPADVAREIVIVARDRTFYLDGDTTPNPTIRLKTNERVRLVLRNEDVGMAHNVAIEPFGVKLQSLRGLAITATEFRAPARSGHLEYYCTPHPRTMRGAIEIE